MRIVVYGAGAVGRALIGRIFCNAGHRVVFVEKQMEITRRLQTNSYYPLQTGQGLQWVGPVVAVMPGGEQEELRAADVVVCCVRVENMEDAATSLVNTLVGRPKDAKRVDVLVVENMPHADLHLKNLTQQIANEALNNVFFSQGIAECVIPEVDPDVQLLDPALMNGDQSGYLVVSKELQEQWNRVRGIEFVNNIGFAWDLKWYCHCALHAVLGYVGLARGLTYIDEVITHKAISDELDSLYHKIVRQLSGVYPGNRTYQIVYVRLFQTELENLASPVLRDTCARVARDPARKVAPGERLRDLEALIGGHPLVTEAIQQAEKMAEK